MRSTRTSSPGSPNVSRGCADHGTTTRRSDCERRAAQPRCCSVDRETVPRCRCCHGPWRSRAATRPGLQESRRGRDATLRQVARPLMLVRARMRRQLSSGPDVGSRGGDPRSWVGSRRVDSMVYPSAPRGGLLGLQRQALGAPLCGCKAHGMRLNTYVESAEKNFDQFGWGPQGSPLDVVEVNWYRRRRMSFLMLGDVFEGHPGLRFVVTQPYRWLRALERWTRSSTRWEWARCRGSASCASPASTSSRIALLAPAACLAQRKWSPSKVAWRTSTCEDQTLHTQTRVAGFTTPSQGCLSRISDARLEGTLSRALGAAGHPSIDGDARRSRGERLRRDGRLLQETRRLPMVARVP